MLREKETCFRVFGGLLPALTGVFLRMAVWSGSPKTMNTRYVQGPNNNFSLSQNISISKLAWWALVTKPIMVEPWHTKGMCPVTFQISRTFSNSNRTVFWRILSKVTTLLSLQEIYSLGNEANSLIANIYYWDLCFVATKAVRRWRWSHWRCEEVRAETSENTVPDWTDMIGEDAGGIADNYCYVSGLRK